VDLKKHKEEQQDFMKRALATLDTLDERAEKIDVRLGQIETRMRELEEEEEKERKEKEKIRNGRKRRLRMKKTAASGGAIDCSSSGQGEDRVEASWEEQCFC
jgi:hypothetical protein